MAIELESTSNPTPLLGKNAKEAIMISARARRAPEPKRQKSPVLRGFGSVPTILAWGSGVGA